MPDVTVNLQDLKKLVKHCFERDVDSRATGTVLSRYAEANPARAISFDIEVQNEKLNARTVTTGRYHRLMTALEDEADIAAALKELVGGMR
jgi:hypothetical protein